MKSLVGFAGGLLIALGILGAVYWFISDDGGKTATTDTAGTPAAQPEASAPHVDSTPVQSTPVQSAPAKPDPSPAPTPVRTAPTPEPAPAQPTPPPEPEPTNVITQADIDNMVTQRQNNVSVCYNVALVEDPGLFGTIQAEISVGTNGQVRSVKFGTNTMRNQTFEECLEYEIRSWRFEPAAYEFTGSYTFTFSR